MAMILSSPAFAPSTAIPVRHTCDGENVSPPLAWRDVPAGTESFALVCTDPDAPAGTFYHWAIFDITASVRELAAGIVAGTAAGFRQADNDFGKPGYGGPCPPRGHGPHHYHFRLYALAVPRLPVGARVDCRLVEAASRRHALNEALLIGIYQRG